MSQSKSSKSVLYRVEWHTFACYDPCGRNEYDYHNKEFRSITPELSNGIRTAQEADRGTTVKKIEVTQSVKGRITTKTERFTILTSEEIAHLVEQAENYQPQDKHKENLKKEIKRLREELKRVT